MALKRKAVAKSATSLFKGAARGKAGRRNAKEEEGAEAEEEEQPEAVPGEAEHEEPDEEEDGAGEDEDEEEEEEVDEEALIAQKEEEASSSRRKELKGMAVGDIKQLAEENELELGNKADMIEAIVAHEAKQRADARAHQKKLREVVIAKKEELEGLSVPDLRDRCQDAGIKGTLTKQARVELLMKQWQENDGVDKGLKQIARDAREQELESMDKAMLRKLCEQVGLNPFVKEVAVDRIVRRENEAGRFKKPAPGEALGKDAEDGEDGEPARKKAKKKDDMVEALLAQEANRKKELERKKQEEEAAASRRKDLKAMSVEELKTDLSKRGREPAGKKDELVEQLFTAMAEDEAAAAKRSKLKALGPDELKRLLAARGVEAESGKKDALVDALLAHEAKQLEEVRRYAERTQEVLDQKREELEAKTGAELKDLCISKGLKQGLTKEDRVERLLEDIAAGGEVDKVLAVLSREARRKELFEKEQAELLKLCEASGADPLVKEVLVERVLEHEDAFGRIEVSQEPPSKRSRTAKKQ